MDDLVVCGVAESVATGELRRDPSARYWVEAGLSTAGRDLLREQVQSAFAAWSQVANVHGEEASSPQEAHCLIRVTRIDGRQGVLADCMLPGPPVQLMRLDNSEKWVVHVGADVPADSIDLYRVLVHELGHFWGLGHAPQGSPNLMAPAYSRAIWTPRQWDVEQMVRLYGHPSPTPPAPGENRIPTKLVFADGIVTILDQYGHRSAAYRHGELTCGLGERVA